MLVDWDGKPMVIKPSKVHKFKKILSLINRDGSLLDVGCGNGLFHDYLVSNGFKSIDAFDITPSYIDFAQKNHPCIWYKVHDACKPFPYTQGFDIVTCVELLEHVPSPYLVIKNMYDVCNKDGICVVSTPNALRFEIKYGNRMNYRLGEYNFQYLSPTILLSMMNKAGFKVDYTSGKYLGRFSHIFVRGVKQ